MHPKVSQDDIRNLYAGGCLNAYARTKAVRARRGPLFAPAHISLLLLAVIRLVPSALLCLVDWGVETQSERHLRS